MIYKLLLLAVELVNLLSSEFSVVLVIIERYKILMADLNFFFEEVLYLALSQNVMGLGLSDD